jgi:hypothetical protein
MRSGNTLSFSLPSATDSHPQHSGNFGTVTGRLLRGDEVLRTFDFGVFGSVDVEPGESQYRLEVSTHRQPNSQWRTTSSSETTWNFSSSQVGGDGAPLPLIDLDYRLDLDELNEVRAGKPHRFEVSARRMDLDRLDLRSMDVWLSYNDGADWDKAGAKLKGDGTSIKVRHPKLHETNGFVALRVIAEDRAGNSIEQTTQRAFALE